MTETGASKGRETTRAAMSETVRTQAPMSPASRMRAASRDAEGAGEEPREQPEEGNGPGEGDGRGGQQGDADGDDGTDHGGPVAQAPGQVVPERQGGERAGHQEGDEESQGEDGGDAAEFAEALDPREGAEDPEAESVVGLRGVDDDDAGEPAEGGTERRTGEDQAHGRATAASAGYEEDKTAGDHRTHESADEIGVTGIEAEQRDARHDTERRARVDAEEAGFRQRVARDRLEEAAYDAEGGADEQRGEGARQAEIADDEGEPGVVARAVAAEQVVQDAAGADLARADGEGEGRQQHDREGQSGNGHHHGPPARVGRGSAPAPGRGSRLSRGAGALGRSTGAVGESGRAVADGRAPGRGRPRCRPAFGSRGRLLPSGGGGRRGPVGFASVQLNGRGVMFGSRGRGPRARRLHKVRLA